jgi:hypothetical protein
VLPNLAVDVQWLKKVFCLQRLLSLPHPRFRKRSDYQCGEVGTRPLIVQFLSADAEGTKFVDNLRGCMKSLKCDSGVPVKKESRVYYYLLSGGLREFGNGSIKRCDQPTFRR